MDAGRLLLFLSRLNSSIFILIFCIAQTAEATFSSHFDLVVIIDDDVDDDDVDVFI